MLKKFLIVINMTTNIEKNIKKALKTIKIAKNLHKILKIFHEIISKWTKKILEKFPEHFQWIPHLSPLKGKKVKKLVKKMKKLKFE